VSSEFLVAKILGLAPVVARRLIFCIGVTLQVPQMPRVNIPDSRVYVFSLKPGKQIFEIGSVQFVVTVLGAAPSEARCIFNEKRAKRASKDLSELVLINRCSRLWPFRKIKDKKRRITGIGFRRSKFGHGGGFGQAHLLVHRDYSGTAQSSLASLAHLNV